MEKLTTTFGNSFVHIPAARCCTDAIFQQSNKPGGNVQEAEPYFHSKYKLYGVKMEVSVLPNGQVIDCTNHFPGSTANIQIFRENMEFHTRELRKLPDDHEVEDTEPMHDIYVDQWCAIVDKNYERLADKMRAVHPARALPGERLSLEEERMNHKISSDRMVVEDYFGRLCGLWWICSDKFRWGVTLYDDIVRVCLALTNAHAGVRPLRTQDADYYHGRENSLVATRQEMRAKRRLAQTKHLNKKKRLESDFSQV
ncbi:Succinyl-coa:3-ketoacid coenzyme a transferase, partial [Globisporangium splendens]